MSQLVGVRLTDENASLLDEMRERQPPALDEVINRALSNYFFTIRFDDLRAPE